MRLGFARHGRHEPGLDSRGFQAPKRLPVRDEQKRLSGKPAAYDHGLLPINDGLL